MTRSLSWSISAKISSTRVTNINKQLSYGKMRREQWTLDLKKKTISSLNNCNTYILLDEAKSTEQKRPSILLASAVHSELKHRKKGSSKTKIKDFEIYSSVLCPVSPFRALLEKFAKIRQFLTLRQSSDGYNFRKNPFPKNPFPKTPTQKILS